MRPEPCPVCGYPAPPGHAEPDCSYCRGELDGKGAAGRFGRFPSEVALGFAALPQGLVILVRTPGIRGLLVPPVVLTVLLFGLIAVLGWNAFERVSEAFVDPSRTGEWDEGWLRTSIEWLLSSGLVAWLGNLSQALVFLLTLSLLVSWTFSIAYEALAGPFLDAIQGRLEARWFGADPRALLEGTLEGSRARRVIRFAGLELRTLWVSVQAAALAGLILLFFLWVKFLPVVGSVLFFALAGFTTSISLLDIPFSRRRWSLRRRLGFLKRHAGGVVAFGAVAAIVYLVPVVGQLIMVPAASIGGLWFFCRLDK